MNEWLRRIKFLLHRGEFERELDEEMQHHLALKTAEVGEGAARKQFGNTALLREESRSMWTITFWEQFAQDVRYGLRAMASNRLFTAMAVASLALGIGANTAIYSFMDAVLLRSLPVRNPEQLVIANWHARGRSGAVHGVNGTMYRENGGPVSPNFPYAAWEAMRGDRTLISPLFGYATAWQINLVTRNQAELAQGVFVSGEYFSGLGVTPAAGRLIQSDDDRAGAPPLAVLSYSEWQRAFALNPDAVGSQITINNVIFTIIGVSAPGFFGVDSGGDPRVFLPLHLASLLAPNPAADEKRRFSSQEYWVEMMGRLKPGVTMQQAQSSLAGQFSRYVESTMKTAKDRVNPPSLFLQEGSAGVDSLRRRYSKPLLVLMTMVGLILTIACANIANLLLARATARRREMAVRLSLGAGRMRVVRQLLTESLLLSLSGAVLGLFVALAGIRAISALLTTTRTEDIVRAHLNWPVLAFTLGLAVLTGIVFGLVPALQATSVDITPALKETRASAVQTRSRRFGIGFGLSHALVVSQIALSLVLVVAASLFVRTLANLRSVELGFNQESLLLFKVNARQAGYHDQGLANFYASLTERFRAMPGVVAAAASGNALVSGYWNDEPLNIAGVPPGEKKQSSCIVASDHAFLSTMQIPILLGRSLEPRDMQSPKVAVVSEQFVKEFFSGASPIGKRISFGDPKNTPDIEIVGVAKDTRYNSLKNQNPTVAYVPYTEDLKGLESLTFELRARGNPVALAAAVREIVHQANAAVPVAEVRTQQAVIDEGIQQERTFANLCTCFAALALAIACVGLYGTMAYTVARRTSEIGIRMALGAQRAVVVRMIVRDVFVLAAAGLSIGLLVAWETSHFVASFLFGMKPNDPVSLGGAVGLLIVAAIAAGYAPARKASRIDPMVALRHE